MTTTLNDIEKEIGLKLNGPIKWKDKISCKNEGIYIVVTPNNHPLNIDFDREQIKLWISKVPKMMIDKQKPNYENITQELNKFWFDNEIILYIGQTTKSNEDSTRSIEDRIREYYTSKIYKKSPNSGGYWLKTLAFLDECLIYWTKCNNPKKVEEHILTFFHHQFLKDKITKENVHLPFANLKVNLSEKPKEIRKQHILKKPRI
ncbi:MAG: hypothetical protein KAQ92_04215 [Candidatus Aenigmarchaeota archaeon]|nr:hypothetical protein [Candidatus Aenigmarchaeota archaeon]